MKKALAIDLANETGRFLAAIKAKRAVVSKTEDKLNSRLSGLFAKAQDKLISKLESSGGRLSDAQVASVMQSVLPDVRNAILTTEIEAGGAGVSRDLLAERAFVASQSTIDRMTGDVIESLSESMNQGLGIDESARSLRDRFDDMEQWERERIARTEINGAQNLGNYNAMLNDRIQYHQWITAEDDRVRDTDAVSHVVLHGEIVKVGQAFSNGLKFPGDRSGPIQEWINCRCVSVAYFMPDGMMAPWDGPFFEDDLVEAPIPDGVGDIEAGPASDFVSEEPPPPLAEEALPEPPLEALPPLPDIATERQIELVNWWEEDIDAVTAARSYQMGDIAGLGPTELKEAEDMVDAIHNLMDNSEPFAGTVYRGFKGDLDLGTGDSFILDALSSSSKNLDTATFFASSKLDPFEAALVDYNGPSVIFEFRTASGLDITPIAAIPEQSEVILREGVRYNVLSVNKRTMSTADGKKFKTKYVVLEQTK